MPETGYSVLGIANEFLARGWVDDVDLPLTHMQLQKLCYMSHGFTLALCNQPLTYEPIEAWDYGPVYPDLYDALKFYGSDPIEDRIRKNNWAMDDNFKGPIVTVDLPKRKREIIEDVWENYGHMAGFKLSALTHKDDTPWAQFYKPGRKNIKITDDSIRRYFIGLAGGH